MSKNKISNIDIDAEIDMFKRKNNLLHPKSCNLSIAALKKIEILDEINQSNRKKIDLIGKSCFVFSSGNRVRQVTKSIVEYKYYDSFVLTLIIVSTILLTLDNPLNDPESTLSKTLGIIDYFMSAAFTLECAINIILLGFLFNGKTSYMRDSWNILDFMIVIFSLTNIALTSYNLGIMKLFRMLRVLRPLRVLKRNFGLKIQVVSLINAIPGIMNLLAITILLLMLFGIQGVNFFAGKMFYCNVAKMPEATKKKINSQWDCYDYGGEWLRFSANFDDVGQAMLTMFTMMTNEGWTEVMWQTVDATEIHQMPSRNHKPLFILFCCLFLILGSLFILNLFVGVVIDTFKKEKYKLSNNNYLTRLQFEYLEVLHKCYSLSP